jgi:hypothetical protein
LGHRQGVKEQISHDGCAHPRRAGRPGGMGSSRGAGHRSSVEL